MKLVGQPVFDFGTMPKTSDGVHSWEIQNVGEGELDSGSRRPRVRVPSPRSRDDKTKGKGKGRRSGSRSPPGGSTSIEVTWETKNWVKFDQTATLGTNDLDTPILSLIDPRKGPLSGGGRALGHGRIPQDLQRRDQSVGASRSSRRTGPG